MEKINLQIISKKESEKFEKSVIKANDISAGCICNCPCSPCQCDCYCPCSCFCLFCSCSSVSNCNCSCSEVELIADSDDSYHGMAVSVQSTTSKAVPYSNSNNNATTAPIADQFFEQTNNQSSDDSRAQTATPPSAGYTNTVDVHSHDAKDYQVNIHS